jgi:ankyrin repeat protein
VWQYFGFVGFHYLFILENSMGDLRKFRNSNAKSICSVFIPSSCKWNQLLGLVSLRLNCSKPIHHFEALINESEPIYIGDISVFKKCCLEATNPSELIFVAHDEPVDQKTSSSKRTESVKRQDKILVSVEEISKMSSTDSFRTIPILFKAQDKQLQIPLEENCSWNDLVRTIDNSFHFIDVGLQSLIMHDEDGDQISSIIDNSSKFWKFQSMHLGEEGNYFLIHTTPVVDDTNPKKATHDVHSTSDQSHSSLLRHQKASKTAATKLPSDDSGDEEVSTKVKSLSQSSSPSPWLNSGSKNSVVDPRKQQQQAQAGEVIAPKKQQPIDMKTFIQHCFDGDLKAVKQLYQLHGPHILHLTDNQGYTALHGACRRVHTFLIQWLIKAGANILARDHEGNTPLHIMCTAGSNDFFIFCQQHCPNFSVNVSNENHGTTLLHVATHAGDLNLVRWMLDTNSCEVLNSVNEKGFTALHTACWKNHPEIGKLLVERGACVNAKDLNGFTPIYLAAAFTDVSFVKWLRESGASTSVITVRGDTVLHVATQCDAIATVEYLLSIGSNPEQPNFSGLTPLQLATSNEKLMELFSASTSRWNQTQHPHLSQYFHACEVGNETEVHQLVQDDLISVDKTIDKYCHTGLHVACIYGHTDLVASFIEDHGADVNHRDADGANLLHLAALYGHLDICQYLTEHTSIDIQQTSRTGDTPLHYACQAGHQHIVEYYYTSTGGGGRTEFSISPSHLLNLDHDNLLHTCARFGQSNLAEYLMTATLPSPHPLPLPLINAKNKYFQTPLHLACAHNNSRSTVELLCQSMNSDEINSVDSHGMTPFLHACQNGNLELAQLLFEYGGADVTSLAFPVQKGNSALHFVCESGTSSNTVELIEWLIEELKCDVKVKNLKQQTCYDVAKLSSNSAAVRWFKEHDEILSLLEEDSDSDSESDSEDEEEKSNSRPPRVEPPSSASILKETLQENTPLMSILHKASLCGNYIVVKKCLQDGVDCNLRTATTGMTPLHCACRAGHFDIVKHLVTSGAMIKLTDSSGLTPLQYARDGNHEEIVGWLTEQEKKLVVAPAPKPSFLFSCLPVSTPSLTSTSASSSTKLTTLSATKKNNLTTMKRAAGPVGPRASSTASTTSSRSNTSDDEKSSSLKEIIELCNACTQGDLLEVKRILTPGSGGGVIDINVVSPPGNRTPLHCACLSGNLPLVSFLIAKGANINAQNLGGLTPLHISCDRGYADISLELITHGALIEIPNKNGNTPLHLLCLHDHTALFQQIILLPRTVVRESLDIDRKNSEGLTFIHLAVLRKNMELVEFLSSYPSQINARESQCHETPLHFSCKGEGRGGGEGGGCYDITSLLLTSRHTVYVNARNDHGVTALHYASQSVGNLRLVKLLVKAGANLQQECDRGYTALHYACECGEDAPLVKYLIKSGLDPTEKNEKNVNPLQLVDKDRFPELYEWLLAWTLATKVGKTVEEVLEEIHGGGR